MLTKELEKHIRRTIKDLKKKSTNYLNQGNLTRYCELQYEILDLEAIIINFRE
jgi:hypothetical protein